MCGGSKSPATQPAPPPVAPAESAELKVGEAEDTTNKKKRKGTSKLTIPLQKQDAPTTGLNIPKAT